MNSSMFTVSTLVHYLKQKIDADMNVQSVLIKGEISNFTNHRSGHWYFTLKDKKSRISCVMFASYASRCKILLKEGMQVIVQASLSVYEPQGNCQLNVTKVQMDGIGELFLQFEQLKEKLAREGLFDPAHKKPLPAYPMKIAIISAKEGAALQDVRTTLARRWPLAQITFIPSLVQGKDAPKALIENLQYADSLGVDVILLTRGGGPIEELWCFNDEQLARCIYALKTVIVSGVGHETDTMLVDYVSDARAATPTAAAELVSPDRKEVAQYLQAQKMHLFQSIRRKLQEADMQLARIHAARYIKDPFSYIQEARMNVAMHTKELGAVQTKLQNQRNALDTTSTQLAHYFSAIEKQAKEDLGMRQMALRNALALYQHKQNQQFSQQVSLLDALSPLKILSRGYSVLYQGDHIVKSIHDLHQEPMQIRMQDGIVHATLDHKEEF